METHKTQPAQIPTRSQLRLLLGTAALSLAISAALLAFGFVFLQKANASRDWPAVTGRVQNVRVTWNLSNSQGSMPDREYFFEVHYTYAVEGQTYTGKRFSLGHGSNAAGRTYDSEEAARAAAAAYTAGSAITVYYDPAAPEEAVLLPGAGFGAYAPLLLGLLFLLAGAALLRFYSRRKALVSGHGSMTPLQKGHF
ncbi:MAG: hypothetical protein KatS3mg050_3365 [Litorilinea sp.]|nr:MAG: hypothetical protein KatS3mg050_3365 [Litorilinea sp.]